MSILGFDKTKYPQPTFEPKAISKKAVIGLKPRLLENEEKDAAFFTTRRKKSKKKIDRFYEEALNRFAGFWDNADAFEKDAPMILEKWDLLLGGHDYTAYVGGRDVSRVDVAASVYNGRGYTGNGFLGGNPFCDTALLRACKSCQASADAAFDQWYAKRLAVPAYSWAKRFSLNLNAWFEDWWICFKTEIYEVQGQNAGLLNAYNGGCGLACFAGPSVWQFLTREWVKGFDGWMESNDNGNDEENGEEKGKQKRKRVVQWPKDENGRDISFEASKVDDICSDDLDYWKKELSDAYAQAFDRMSDLERRVFKLRLGDFEDGVWGNAMANRQVALKCNIEEPSASACYSRGYKKIDDVLAELYNKKCGDDVKFLRRWLGRYFRPNPRIEKLFAKKIKVAALQANDKTEELVDYLDYTTYSDLFAYCKRIDPQTGKIK